MVFSSAFFLTIFLPIVLAGCWLLGWLEQRWCTRRGRPFTWMGVNLLLLLSSLFFYFWGEGLGVGWLIASVLFNALCGKQLAARESPAWRKGWLAACLVVNLAFLGWFKYAGFAVHSINLLPGLALPVPEVVLPLGISFYTFQAMSYVFDVYRRDVQPSRSVWDFACYVTMFPQLVAGPIVRYADVAARLQQREIRFDQVASGWKRFLCGLGKKVLLANTLGQMADAVWGVVEQGHGVPTGMAWVGLLCYTLQIYYDFSGYSDMAIGMGRMLGFEFLENFRHPYSALSIRDFWRKWHISLSTWFRDYVYIPLGGNRISHVRTGLNCLLVFGLCGLWHGPAPCSSYGALARILPDGRTGVGTEGPETPARRTRLPSELPGPAVRPPLCPGRGPGRLGLLSLREHGGRFPLFPISAGLRRGDPRSPRAVA
jgi:alginate O-acetyltransferase complex protein AlgI